MHLTRPLAVFDLETTGPNVATDRIVDISIVTRLPDGGVERWSSLVNPGMPIPKSATEVHGITDAMVSMAPPFIEVATEVLNRLEGCDLGGFNVSGFDLPLLQAELARCAMSLDMAGRHVVDALSIFRAKEKRDLGAAVLLYLGRTHDGAHRAEADAWATLQVLEAQAKHYRDLPQDVPGLAAACRPVGAVDVDGKLMWREGFACFSFGKHSGHSLQWVRKNDSSFLSWILRSDFSAEVKALVKDALDGKFPKQETQRAA